MAFSYITRNKWFGGNSFSNKMSQNQFGCRRLVNFDIHRDPSYLYTNPQMNKISGNVVKDLILFSADASPYNTNKYHIGNVGRLYQEDSLANVTYLSSISDSVGNGLEIFDDYLYYMNNTTIGRYGKLSDTPSFSPDFLSDGTTNVDQSLVATGDTYTLKASISELAVDKQTFTPTRDPLKSIQLNILAKGSGDWTLVVHDSNDVEIASVTVINTDLSTGDYTFTFSTPARVVIGNQYHFHVYSTVADGTITTSTNNDLETASFKTFFGILINNPWHPATKILNSLVVANDGYLAHWDRAIYNPNKITFETGFQCVSMTKLSEYIVCGTYKGNSIDNVEEAKLYFWDGIQSTFNFSVQLAHGLPQALHVNSAGQLIGIYGRKGTIYRGATTFEKILDAPNLTHGKKVEVYPGGITEYQGKTYIAYAGNTDDNTNFEQGTYCFGTSSTQLPEALSLAYTTSEGTTRHTSLQLGMVKGYGQYLYQSVRYSTGDYGLERCKIDDNSAGSATFGELRIDNGNPNKEKKASKYVVTHDPLQNGDSLQLKAYINRSSSVEIDIKNSEAGSTRTQLDINKVYKEIDLEFVATTSNSSFPVIISTEFEYNPELDSREDD